MKKTALAWWKLVATWVLFLAHHSSYETFPNPLFRIIGEEGETTFFHMQMLFFSYVFVTLVEIFLRRTVIGPLSDFIFSRALLSYVAFTFKTPMPFFITPPGF